MRTTGPAESGYPIINIAIRIGIQVRSFMSSIVRPILTVGLQYSNGDRASMLISAQASKACLQQIGIGASQEWH